MMTQQQKIVKLMADRRDTQQWFFPFDLMPPRLDMGHECFVGYEASARLSDLAREYPDMVETMSEGKYKKRRIRWETQSLWQPNLPSDLRQLMPGQEELPF